MNLTVNLRTLAQQNVVLRGELSPAELDLDLRDEIIQVRSPLHHDLEVELLPDALLVRGRLWVTLDCECVRCLKPFQYDLVLDPYTLHLPFTGEEAVILDNDNADLTPFLREDMLLELPQHPLCKPDCAGVKTKAGKQARQTGAEPEAKASAWAELNKLKL
jgi:uncharacterized protein